MTALVDLTIPQGSSWSRSIIWKTGDPSLPVDLDGFTARLQLRPSQASTTITLEMKTGDGIVIDAAAGMFTLSISAIKTAAIGAGRYSYDLEATSGGGQVTRVCQGLITITPETTR